MNLQKFRRYDLINQRVDQLKGFQTSSTQKVLKARSFSDLKCVS